MIWKRLFPPEGGGTLRRWVRMRKEMFEHAVQNEQEYTLKRNNLQSYMKPLTIFDFNKYEDDVADALSVHIGSNKGGWRISDDEVIGGFSRAAFTLQEEAKRSKNNKNNDEATNSENHKFIRWEGNIDTRIGPRSRAKKSGFCAIRCPEFPFGGIPVGIKYNALEVQCRSDGRTYTFNLKVDSYFPDDLYQSHITVSPQEILDAQQKKGVEKNMGDKDVVVTDPEKDFVSVVLPFQDFILTSHGRVKHYQRTLDGAIQLKHLGLTLMDQKDGPFQFDLARIRLVNYRDGEIVCDSNDDDDQGETIFDHDDYNEDEENRQERKYEEHDVKKNS